MKMTIMELNVPNKNGRIYTTEAMTKAIEKFNDRTCYGTLGYPDDFSAVDLNKVSHQFENLRIEDNKLVGDLTILTTPNGLILQNIIQEGMEVVYRPGGFGGLKQTDLGFETTDYQLATIVVIPKDQAA